MIKKEELDLFKFQEYKVLKAKLLKVKERHPKAPDGHEIEACVNGNIVTLLSSFINEDEDKIWGCLSNTNLLKALSHYLHLEGFFIRNARLPLNKQGAIEMNSNALIKGGGWNQDDFLLLQLFSYVKHLCETKWIAKETLDSFEDKLYRIKLEPGCSRFDVLLIKEIYLLVHAYKIRMAYRSILKVKKPKEHEEQLKGLFEKYFESISPLLEENWSFCIPCGSTDHAVYLMLSKIGKDYHVRIDDSSRKEVTVFITPHDKVKVQGGLINYLEQVAIADTMNHRSAMMSIYNQESRFSSKPKLVYMIAHKNPGYQSRKVLETDHCVYQSFLFNRYYRLADALGVCDILSILTDNDTGYVTKKDEYRKPTSADWDITRTRAQYNPLDVYEVEKMSANPNLFLLSSAVAKVENNHPKKVSPATLPQIKESDFSSHFAEYSTREIVHLINQSKYQEALDALLGKSLKSSYSTDWKLSLLKGICLSRLLKHSEAWDCFLTSEDKIKKRDFSNNLFLFLKALDLLHLVLYYDCSKIYSVDSSGRVFLILQEYRKLYLKNFRIQKLDMAIMHLSKILNSIKNDANAEKLKSGVHIIDKFSIEWVEFYLLYSGYVRKIILLIDAFKIGDDKSGFDLIKSIHEDVANLEKQLELVCENRSYDTDLINALKAFQTECHSIRRVEDHILLNKENSDANSKFIPFFEYPVLYNCELIRDSILIALIKYRDTPQKQIRDCRHDTHHQLLFNQCFIKVGMPYANDFFLEKPYAEYKSLVRMYDNGIKGLGCGTDIFVFYKILFMYLKGFEFLEIRELGYQEDAIDRGIFRYVEDNGFQFVETWVSWFSGHESHLFISNYLLAKFRCESDQRELKLLQCWHRFDNKDLKSELQNYIREKLNYMSDSLTM